MKKGCIIALAVLFVIVSIGMGVYFYQQSKKEKESIEFVKPAYDNVIQKTVATGSIKPRLEVNIKPQVSGIVDRLYVEAGEIVKKGQELARIQLVPSPTNVNNADAQVQQAKINVQQAERELDRQRTLNTQSLDVEEARANFINTEKEEQRYKQLFDQGVVSEQEYNGVKLNFEVAKANFENAKIRSSNDLKQFEDQLDIRKSELDAAITNLQLLKEGVSKKYGNISNTIVSTVDGMVLDVPVEEGSSVVERNNFNEGTSIAVVADMNTLVFEGQVDESEVGKLKEGMPIELTVGALEDIKINAFLEHIAPQGVVDEGTVKFEIKAAVIQSDTVFLRAGYSASGDIILDRRDSVLTLFERDVIFSEEGDSTFVEYKLNDKKEVEKKQIEIGISDGIKVELITAIDTSQEIKVQGK